ncbi:MAG: patatin [Flaviaesturariibacter sp.]|nr:patatin [Flaviaesturariibacter sp.]
MRNRLLLFLLLPVLASAQPPTRNLVFEGAGIRGIAYSGAIQELEKQHLLPEVKRVGGTSAGAITALALSLRYSASEISSLIAKTPFKKFNEGRFLFFGGLNRFKKYFGWYRSGRVDEWFGKMIAAKTGNANITFLQMKESGFKDLYVTATCLNKQSLVVFSWETYPHMKVKDAVRISMSIPLYFEAVFIDAFGNVVLHPKDKTGLDIMVDGGFIANFPIRLFDSTKFIDPSLPNAFAVNPHTIGFRIDSDEQIEKDKTSGGLAPMPLQNLNDYFLAFYTIILENLNRQTLTKEDWQRTVSISDGAIAPRIRKLSHDEIQALTGNGREALYRYLGN